MSTEPLPHKINDLGSQNTYEALFQSPLLTPMKWRAVGARWVPRQHLRQQRPVSR